MKSDAHFWGNLDGKPKQDSEIDSFIKMPPMSSVWTFRSGKDAIKENSINVVVIAGLDCKRMYLHCRHDYKDNYIQV